MNKGGLQVHVPALGLYQFDLKQQLTAPVHDRSILESLHEPHLEAVSSSKS